MESSEEAHWVVDYHLLWGDSLSLFDHQGAFLRMCDLGGLFDLQNKEYVVFMFHLDKAQLPPSFGFIEFLLLQSFYP